MTTQSKVLGKLPETAHCKDIFHPWAEQCNHGAAIMWWDSFRSSSKFYAVLYLFQSIVKRSADYKYITKCYVQSVLMSTLSSSIFTLSNCIMRNGSKRFFKYWIGFGAGILAGLPIFLESSSRKNLLNITYFNMVLDMVFRRLDKKGYSCLTESLKIKLPLFMLINSVLLYKLRKDPRNQTSTLWFFIPSHSNKQQDNGLKSRCYHSDPCWKNIGKTAAFYFMFGTGIQIAKVILYSGKFGPPKLAEMGFPIFCAAYVAFYKAVICGMYQKKQSDLPTHALLGGLISGAAFWFYPARSIFLAALGNLIKILENDFKEAKSIPDSPYSEISFMIYNGLLYHARILNPEVCPSFFITIINLITNGNAQVIYTSFERKMNEAKLAQHRIT